MRLAFLSSDPAITFGDTQGESIQVAELAGAFPAAGAEVLLVVSSCQPAARPPDGVTLELLPAPGNGSYTADRLAAEPARAAWLRDRLAEFGAEALYERLAPHSTAGSDAARALGIPHIVALNAPLPADVEPHGRLDQLEAADRHERTVLRGADLVLPISRPLADYARSRGARRVEIVPNAVTLERFVPGRAPAGLPIAVLAGSLQSWHGLDTLVEAWALLGGSAPELFVIGDGPGRPLLEAAGALVTGTVPHAAVPAIFAGAHIGLAPYALDSPDYFSPIELFEYLAGGLATIAGDLPAVRDVVSPETAVVVPRGDAQALARAVASLAGNPARRERLGRAARAVVAACHTWKHRARTILELAEELATVELPLHRPA